MLLWNVFTQILLPILVLFGSGWLLDRRTKLDLTTLVKLNIWLVVPAFIFHEVIVSDLDAQIAVRVSLFTFTVIASMFFVSLAAARIAGYDREQTRSLQLATMFYNSGNYGIPLMSLAYPALGPALQIVVVITQNISTFTIGLLLAASAKRPGLRALAPMLRQAPLWAVLSGVVLRLLHAPITEVRWFWVPIEYLHKSLVGLALVTLGVQLSQTSARQNFSRISWALALRLLGGPLIACVLVVLFGFRGQTAIIMIVSSAFPTAVNTALLAHEFKADAEFAAAAVFYSTLASMITVTLLIATLRLPQITALF